MVKNTSKGSNENSNENSKKKKWITLSLVGAALLLIPRRSSRQTLSPTYKQSVDDLAKQHADNTNDIKTQDDYNL